MSKLNNKNIYLFFILLFAFFIMIPTFCYADSYSSVYSAHLEDTALKNAGHRKIYPAFEGNNDKGNSVDIRKNGYVAYCLNTTKSYPAANSGVVYKRVAFNDSSLSLLHTNITESINKQISVALSIGYAFEDSIDTQQVSYFNKETGLNLSEEQLRAATQDTIWGIMNNGKITYNNISKVDKAIDYIYNLAILGEYSKVTIDDSNVALVSISNGTRLYGPFSASYTGIVTDNKIHLNSLLEGATIVVADKEYSEIDIENGESFYIKVNSKELSGKNLVKASIQYRISNFEYGNTGTWQPDITGHGGSYIDKFGNSGYDSGNGVATYKNWQDVVITRTQTLASDEDFATIEWEDFTGSANFYKVDENGNVLTGATFQLKPNNINLSQEEINEIINNSKNVTSMKWDSTNKVFTFINTNTDNETIDVNGKNIKVTLLDSLVKGSYTLTEIKAPKGFIKSSQAITFNITEDGKLELNSSPISTLGGFVNTKISLDLSLEKWVSKVTDSNGIVTYTGASRNTEDNGIEGRNGTIYVTKDGIVTFTIRVFNHGNISAIPTVITDNIPDELEFYSSIVDGVDYAWKMYYKENEKLIETDDPSKATIIKTSYLATKPLIEKHCDFGTAHNGNNYGENVAQSCNSCNYRDIKVSFKVKEINEKNIINKAEIEQYISEYDAEYLAIRPNGNDIWDGYKATDIDSQVGNLPTNHNYENSEASTRNGIKYYREDDEDIAVVTPYALDLSLEKWVSKVTDSNDTVTYNGEDRNTNDNKIEKRNGTIYVEKNGIVTYTIRIFNHGSVDGTATEIKDTIPKELEFYSSVVDDVDYGWKLYYEEDEKLIETNDPSKATIIKTSYLAEQSLIEKHCDFGTAHNGNNYGENTSLSCESCKYKDVKVSFKLKDITVKNIINEAEITEYISEYDDIYVEKHPNTNSYIKGYKVTDIDSQIANHPTDHNYESTENSIRNDANYYREDDEDIAVIVPQIFDLSLEKWVSKVLRKGNEDPVYINDKNTDDNNVENRPGDINVRTGDIVIYTIRISNQGNIDGYAEEIIDSIPSGLEFIDPNGEYETDEEKTAKSINSLYNWELNDNKLVSNFLSKSNSNKVKTFATQENSNLGDMYLNGTVLKAHEKWTMHLGYNYNSNNAENEATSCEKCSYKDVQIAFRVGTTVLEDKTIINRIINLAEISKYSSIGDTELYKIPDIDSIENNHPEGHNFEAENVNRGDLPYYREDDEDIAVIAPEEFDLSLKKWISRIY